MQFLNSMPPIRMSSTWVTYALAGPWSPKPSAVVSSSGTSPAALATERLSSRPDAPVSISRRLRLPLISTSSPAAIMSCGVFASPYAIGTIGSLAALTGVTSSQLPFSLDSTPLIAASMACLSSSVSGVVGWSSRSFNQANCCSAVIGLRWVISHRRVIAGSFGESECAILILSCELAYIP